MASATPASSCHPVAVFGASWATPSTPLYDLSIALGEALAAAEFHVISGGYGGTMEGVSLGATRAGGSAHGVLVPSLFPSRAATGNPYLTSREDAPSLLARIDAMLAAAPALLVALPGTLGTLTEIMCAWGNATLCPLRGARAPLIVCWRKPWLPVLDAAVAGLALPAEVARCITYVDSVVECVAVLRAHVAASA